MKTQIYFVRHGEVHNPFKIWYGRLPFYRLSANGKQQIENTAEYLMDKNIDIIYSSSLLRARQSAEILRKKLGLSKVYFSKEILEVKSSLQGQPDSYLVSRNYDIFASSENEITGETIEDLSQRVQRFIAKLVKLHKGKSIIVVSHGDPIMIVKAGKEGMRKDYIKTGEVYLLTI